MPGTLARTQAWHPALASAWSSLSSPTPFGSGRRPRRSIPPPLHFHFSFPPILADLSDESYSRSVARDDDPADPGQARERWPTCPALTAAAVRVKSRRPCRHCSRSILAAMRSPGVTVRNLLLAGADLLSTDRT